MNVYNILEIFIAVVLGNIVVRVLWRKISMSDNKEKDVDKSNQDGNIDYVDIPAEQQQFTFTYTISEDL
tara:strand:- start:751 stop:957 length:207 start_codon:yes stop_codon:yes gene_type:complete